MTANQRRKQNQQNAEKSTGPKTVEGKEASRKNALKHGLTAEILALPDEDAGQIERQHEAFVDAFDPQSHDEAVLVDQLVLSTLRLERFAKAENAILAEQVRQAESDWDLAQENRVLDLSRTFRVDPAKALIELRSFASGVNWLLTRWSEVKKAFEDEYAIAYHDAMLEVLRLSGFNPETLKTEPIEGYEFYLRMCSCLVDFKTHNVYTDYLRAQEPAIWFAQTHPDAFPAEESVPIVEARIDAEIASLRALLSGLTTRDAASRAGSKARALVPADTSENRLFLRYRNSAEMTFNRTLKTLEKLRVDREKRAAERAENDDPRNEPNSRGRSNTRQVKPGSNVELNGVLYTTLDTRDGHVILGPASPFVDMTVCAAPETLLSVV